MIGSRLLAGLSWKPANRTFRSLPASMQQEIADAMSATSKTDIR